jgi:chromosome segregation protein
MVRLEKISIQGFKSFKRPVSILFPNNFVVITGPNGSGKSNVADSIFFVLGKGSSKYLRAKKASDLIFHGSKKKSPADFAKVSLLFSNESGELPIEDEKAIVTRRLNKEGISSYRLNGRVTTRQQILDIFTQTRLNPGGHNIIRQGDVTKVVEMNPLERREIIDEISGISEYDEKKMKALKELEKVEEKIREAEIILEQKEEIIEKLRKDRDSALEYMKLQNELELVKSTIVWKEFSFAKKHIETSDEEIERKRERMNELGKELRSLDNKMEEKEKELESLMTSLFEVSDQVELNKKLARVESSIQNKRNEIRSNEREVERIERVIENLSMINRRISPNIKPILDFEGVHGLVSDLIIVPDQYKIAMEVAGGSHLNDVVVDTLDVAVHCIKYLKEKRLGRARFLPLDRIKPPKKPELPEGTFGWLSELIHHDRKYANIIEYVFGRTACVNNIDKAKEIAKDHRIRMVTLDGDLLEPSGAVMGGYYVKSKVPPEIKQYLKEKEKLIEENEILRLEIKDLESKLKEMRKGMKRFGGEDIEKEAKSIRKEIDKLREKRREIYEERLGIQEELNNIKVNKAKYEANFETLKLQWEEYEKVWEKFENREFFAKRSVSFLKGREREILESITSLGPVNLKAIDEFEILMEEFEEFRERVDKIVEEKNRVLESITEIENKKREVFLKTMDEMAKLFKEIYFELTQGEAELGLEEPDDINSGLLISASPPGKKLLYIDSMSGGEKVLTALAFLFTIQRYKPSPFYVLDEVDAALDKPNTRRVVELIKKHSKSLQFIVITHNSEMIKAADQVYGISMEDGESKVIGVKLPEN